MTIASNEILSTFEDALQAWQVLSNGFIDDKGIIRRKYKKVIPTLEEFSAIDYLCDEWDFCWEGL